MSRLSAADILALHDAGIPDALIDKINADSPAPAVQHNDPNKDEQTEKPKTAVEILSGLFDPPEGK